MWDRGSAGGSGGRGALGSAGLAERPLGQQALIREAQGTAHGLDTRTKAVQRVAPGGGAPSARPASRRPRAPTPQVGRKTGNRHHPSVWITRGHVPSLSQNTILHVVRARRSQSKTPVLLSNSSALGKLPEPRRGTVFQGAWKVLRPRQAPLEKETPPTGTLTGTGSPAQAAARGQTEVTADETDGWQGHGTDTRPSAGGGGGGEGCHLPEATHSPQNHTTPGGPPPLRPREILANSRDKPLPLQEASP